MQVANKPILILDFDAVILNSVEPLSDPRGISGTIVPGALDALKDYSDHFEIHMLSHRLSAGTAGKVSILSWMSVNFISELVKRGMDHGSASVAVAGILASIKFTVGSKPKCHAEISAKAYHFTGMFPTPKEILARKDWNEKE